jgi:predicted PurR-regulated permease PerM
VTLSLIMGFVSFVGLSLIGVPDAVLLGLLSFFGDFIPMVGFLLSGLLVALTQSPLQVLATLLLSVLLLQLENNVLYPRIVGQAARRIRVRWCSPSCWAAPGWARSGPSWRCRWPPP